MKNINLCQYYHFPRKHSDQNEIVYKHQLSWGFIKKQKAINLCVSKAHTKFCACCHETKLNTRIGRGKI